MPGAGLIERAKSLRFKRTASRHSDRDETATVGFLARGANSCSNERKYRHRQERSSSPEASFEPSQDGKIKGTLIFTDQRQHEWDRLITSSVVSSSTAETPGGLNIGLALGAPHEKSLPCLPPEYVTHKVSNARNSIDDPIPVQRRTHGHPVAQRGRSWRALVKLFNKNCPSSAELVFPVYWHRYSAPEDPSCQSGSFQGKSPTETSPPQNPQLSCHDDGACPIRPSPATDRTPEPTRSLGWPGEESMPPKQRNWHNPPFRKHCGKQASNHAVNKSPTWPLAHSAQYIPEPPLPTSQDASDSTSPMKLRQNSLLQVEIPHIEMERYSIMFSTLLQPSRTLPLLARRHGHLAEIKLPYREDKENPTSSTLDSPTQPGQRIPSFTPSSLSRCPKSPRASIRSATTSLENQPDPFAQPNIGPIPHSPLHVKTTVTKPQQQNQVTVIVHSPAEDETTGEYALTRDPEPDALADNLLQTPDSLVRRAWSAGSIESNSEGPSPPLMSLPSSREPSARDGGSTPQHVPQPRAFLTEPTAQDAVEISIARQVSVSRRQRQMLVPIVPRQVRPPKRPRLVAGEQEAESRKSSYLTVEHV